MICYSNALISKSMVTLELTLE